MDDNIINNNMSIDEIYNILSSHIFKTYFYLEETNEFKNLIIKEIIKYKEDEYDNNSIYKKIDELTYQYIKHKLSNNNFSYSLICNYINRKVIIIEDAKHAIYYLKKLNIFLEKYKYSIPLELIMKLIKENNIYKELCETIYNNYSIQIKSGKFTEITNNELVLTSIESYCEIKGINIEEDDYITTNNNTKLDDSIFLYLNEIPYSNTDTFSPHHRNKDQHHFIYSHSS